MKNNICKCGHKKEAHKYYDFSHMVGQCWANLGRCHCLEFIKHKKDGINDSRQHGRTDERS